MKHTILLLLSLSMLLTALVSCNNDNPIDPDIVISDVGTIAIVPDIQYYTNDENRSVYLTSILDYLTSEQENISFILQTGDVTNNNQTWQWENGDSLFFSKIPKTIPFVYCLGNHDYGNNGSSKERKSNFPEKMMPVRDLVMPSSQWDNYVRFLMLGDTKIAILSLEFAPRNEVLEWADEVIRTYPDTPFILLTHAFLNNSGKIFDSSGPNCDNKWSQKQYVMGGDYVNDSKEIFDKIVANNSNVKFIICGHCVSKKYIECLEEKNSSGGSVYCIMVNYQHYKDGGSGNIGLLDYSQGHFCLRSFDTVNNTYGKINISFDLEI